MKIVIPDVMSRLANGRVLWIGAHPPRQDMAKGATILDNETDFRLASSEHQAFDLVYLVEPDLGALKQWPLIVDEALRAVGPGGILVVRLIQSQFLSVFKLANFIQQWTKGQFRLVDQVSEDGRFILTVQLTHSAPRSAQVSDIAFGLVTDGRKPASVASFVRSVLALDRPEGTCAPEILICGPEQVIGDLGGLAEHARWVPQPDEFDRFGWITRKKNLLVDAATAENIVVVHDRYSVPTTFMTRLADFGGDFGVVVARQITRGGDPVPDWVMISEDLNWSTPGWLEFGDYHPYAFANGGAIIAKTDILKTVRWNEMLMWGQAEDVELSRRLSAAGVTPRPAREIVLVTETPRPGFREGFERIPWEDGLYPITERPRWAGAPPSGASALGLAPTPRLRPGTVVDLRSRSASQIAQEDGVVFGRQWMPTPGGLFWTGNGKPHFSINSRDVESDLLVGLRLAGSSAVVTKVEINAAATYAFATDDQYVLVLASKGTISPSNIIHVTMEREGAGEVVLSGLYLSLDVSDRRVRPDTDLSFGRGRSGEALLGRGWVLSGDGEATSCGRAAFLILSFARPEPGPLQAALTLRLLTSSSVAASVITLRVDEQVVAEVLLKHVGRHETIRFALPVGGDRTKSLAFDLPEGVSVGLSRLVLRPAKL